MKTAAAAAVRVTHGERVIDAASGTTKLQLAQYLEAIAPQLLPELQGRPVALVRGPDGVGGELFFQKHVTKLSMPGAKVLPAALWPEHDALFELPGIEALHGAAQMNAIEFHTWNSRSKAIGKPDRMVFDLDPGEGITWPQVQEAALLVRALLQELGFQSWVKTSGGKGLHVVVPIAPRWAFDTVKGFTRAVVQHLAATLPERFVAKSGPANRRGRIFADDLRNGFGATTVAAYSPRARPGLGVSMPVSWDELAGVTGSDRWTVANALEHVARRGADPWTAYAGCRQSIAAAMKALDLKPPPTPRPAARPVHRAGA